jgi:hypothetical protein
MLHITPGNVVASLTITEEDIFHAMAYRQVKPKNWRAFIEYLSDHLADAIDQHVYDEIRYLADLYDEKENCPHRRTQTYTTGGLSFTAGQVVDDLRTIQVCLDCGAQLETETE